MFDINKAPPPPSPLTPESLAASNAAREAFGLPPHSEKAPNTPFAWPDDAKQVFYKAELGISPGILRDYPGFKTLSQKSPAALAVTLIGALQDGLLSLANANKFDNAWRQFKLIENILRCATEVFDLTNHQPTGLTPEEDRFIRRLGTRIDLAARSIKQLRGFLK